MYVRPSWLAFDLLKIAVVDLRLAEEVNIPHPTLIIAHVSQVAAGKRSLY